MTIAAIDIGSHTVSLAVIDAAGRDLAYTVAVTGLGRDRAPQDELTSGGIDRTLHALGDCRKIADHHSAKIVAVVTEAGRQAPNASTFLEQATTVLGVRPTVIDAATEARLSWRGAIAAAGEITDGRLVGLIDIGSASTEIAVGRDPTGLSASRSMPFGAVHLTAKEFEHDPPRPDELTNAIGLAFDHTDDTVREMPDVLNVATWVGVAGTVVTIAAVEIGLVTWDEARVHGFRLSRAAAEDVFRTLATESLADRKHNPGLPADRADVIVGGCCALVAVMRRLQLDEIVVSTRGVAHGLAAETRDTLETLERSP